MLPAESGDCFLLNFDENFNILIDTGYNNTYQEYLKEKLIDLKKKEQCINLMVITHIDEDHIGGAIEFFKENGEANSPQIIDVREIWYNTFSHSLDAGNESGELTDRQKSILQQYIAKSSHNKNNEKNIKAISSRQGDTLAGLLFKLGYKDRWNRMFNGAAVSTENEEAIIFNDIVLHILSPTYDQLESLAKKWIKELKKRDVHFIFNKDRLFDSAYEQYTKMLVSDKSFLKSISEKKKDFEAILENRFSDFLPIADTSKSNGSSIAFSIDYKGKSLLFLADAHENIVIETLEKVYGKDNKNFFDIIKLSHHGSERNNFHLLEKIDGMKYLFSTNGKKHEHPSMNVIAKIIMENKGEKMFYFNYPIGKIEKEIDKSILQEKYKYTVIQKNNGTTIEV